MKIRYDIKTGKLGKAYPDNMVVPQPYIELTAEEFDAVVNTGKVAFIVDGKIVYKEKHEIEAEEMAAKFHKEFFNTSLGYVRRKVTMKDGTVKDFLADILPILKPNVPILTYTEDGLQNKILVTEGFIDECKAQVLADFYGE